MPLQPGKIIRQRYRIDRLIGQGGFGAVYQAWDLHMQGPVAIKESPLLDAAAQRQFQSEARLLFNLRHPNLPVVFDRFIIPGQGMYLVMDFIAGEDLQKLLLHQGGKPLPTRQVLLWLRQVAEALDYLHRQTPLVIHRDVKPNNIRITPAGKAVLVDFGIAKVYKHDVTSSGMGMVTPGFSPPEQYSTTRPDPRNDVYALAATAYALLTGCAPPPSVDIAAGNVAPPLPAHRLNPDLPEAMSQALAAGMRLNLAERTPGALALWQAMDTAWRSKPDAPGEEVPAEAIVQPLGSSKVLYPDQATTVPPANTGQPNGAPPAPAPFIQAPPTPATAMFDMPSPRPPRQPRSRRLWWVLGGSAVAVLAGLVCIVAMLLGRGLAQRTGSPTTLVTQAASVPGTAGHTPGPPAASGTPGPLPTSTNLPIPPQPEMLVFGTGSSIPRPKTPITLENADRLKELGTWKVDGMILSLAISNDGRLLAAGVWRKSQEPNGCMYLMNISDPQQAAQPPACVNLGGGVDVVAFSADSQSLALGTWGFQIGVMDLATSQITQLPPGSDGIYALAFHPAQNQLAWGQKNGLVRSSALGGARDAPEFSYQAGASVRDLAYHPQGELLAIGDDTGQVSLLDAHGQLRTSLPLGQQDGLQVNSLAFAPHDGRYLAATGGKDRYGKLMVWDTSTASLILDQEVDAAMNRVLFLADASAVAVADGTSKICFWPLTQAPRPGCQRMPATIFGATLSADGSLLVGGDSQGNISVWGIPAQP